MDGIKTGDVQISQFFLNGDIRGAIAYMRSHEGFKDILPAYAAIFEDCAYRTYEIPGSLNDILHLYQIYFRDTFYCGLPETEAADKLRTELRALLNLPDTDEVRFVLQERNQKPLACKIIRLPDTVDRAIGRRPAAGPVSPEGEIIHPAPEHKALQNVDRIFCRSVRKLNAVDGRNRIPPDIRAVISLRFSEKSMIALRFKQRLKQLRQTQYAVDMKRFPEIAPTELEYRAKLVELHYSGDLNLLQKFLSEADENKTDDAHAVASARIRCEFADTDQRSLHCVQTQALKLLRAHTRELEEKQDRLSLTQQM